MLTDIFHILISTGRAKTISKNDKWNKLELHKDYRPLDSKQSKEMGFTINEAMKLLPKGTFGKNEKIDEQIQNGKFSFDFFVQIFPECLEETTYEKCTGQFYQAINKQFDCDKLL